MKHILLSIFLMSFISCSTKSFELVDEAILPSTLGYLFFKDFLEDYNSTPDAVVNINVIHVLRSENFTSNSSMNVQAFFPTDMYGQNVGSLILDPFGELVLESRESSSFSEVFLCCDSLPPTEEYNLIFKSNSENYQSFEKEITVDFGYIINTNLEYNLDAEYHLLDTSNDLELYWESAAENESIYFQLCASDVTCLRKEIPDGGSLIVNKEEFMVFPSGKMITIHMFKIVQECFFIDDKNICVNISVYSLSNLTVIK